MSRVVHLYPTKEEIIDSGKDLCCPCCGKSFANVSARRLHVVKRHGILSCDGDKRIYERITDGCVGTYIYHCPAEECRKRDLKFDGMRNLKQHYMRVHTEKTIQCKCGAGFALQKDLSYHEKKRCLLRDLRKIPLRDEEGATPPAKKTKSKKTKYVRKVDRVLNEALRCKDAAENAAGPSTSVQPTSQQVIQPVILVVPSDNIAATVEAIKSAFRGTSEIPVQTLPYETAHPSTEKNTVAVGMDHPSCYDFSGQFNSLAPPFYYSSSTGETANASCSTDQQLVDFAPNTTICYETQQATTVGFQYDYEAEVLRQDRVRDRATSTNGHYMDDVFAGGAGAEPAIDGPFSTMVTSKVLECNAACVRNAQTGMDASEFDLLRDIETQTTWNDVGLMTDFWTDMGNSP